MTNFISKPNSYTQYKHSTSKLGDQIPSHWKVVRFRNAFSFNKGLNITKDNLQDTGIPCINYGEIHSKLGITTTLEKNTLRCVDKSYTKENNNSLIRHGDIVFADTSEDIEGSGNFTQLASEARIFSGYHTIIARPKEEYLIAHYLAYFLDSTSYRKQVRTSVKGVKVYSVTKSILKNTVLCFPDKSEQEKISAFLDAKSASIDQSIKVKEKQISRLKERKQILIQNAVTRGLDPNAPMQDSGIEWIGEIPKHWNIRRAKYLFQEIDERSASGQEELLSVSHTTGVTPRSEKNVSMFMAEDYTGAKTCQSGDLVFNIMWAWMGALGVSDRPGIVSSSYGVFRQRATSNFNPKYLEFLLKTTSYIEHYNRVSTGLHSSRLRLYPHMFLSMKIGFPNRGEQDQIIEHIDQESAKIDRAIKLFRGQIERLKEYRATLIDSAVTGKIRVPGVEDPARQEEMA